MLLKVVIFITQVSDEINIEIKRVRNFIVISQNFMSVKSNKNLGLHFLSLLSFF